MPVYCQACGAQDDGNAARCRVCGADLHPPCGPETCAVCSASLAEGASYCNVCGTAEAGQPSGGVSGRAAPRTHLPPDAALPLPPLPDGGLAAAMPEWLRSSETTGPRDWEAAASSPHLARGTAFDPTDLRTILSEDDLPEWLRRIADRDVAAAARPPEFAPRASMIDVEPEFAPRIAVSGREGLISVESDLEFPDARAGADAPVAGAASRPLHPSTGRPQPAGDRRRAGIAIVGVLLFALLVVVLLLT